MKITRIECDMCGCIIEDGNPDYQLLHRIKKREGFGKDEFYSIDLCNKCGTQIANGIRDYVQFNRPWLLESKILKY